MSSGGWEVVGKNKKDKSIVNKNGKLTKTEKKKFIENAPKLEDFLPLSQVKTIFDNLDDDNKRKVKVKSRDNNDKENEEKKKSPKHNKQKEVEKKNSQQQQQQKDKPKQKAVKPADKSLISIQQINEIIDTNKARFPDAPLIWLKDLVSYLNKKITNEKDDLLFNSKNDNYPLNLVAKPVISLFEKIIKQSGQGNVQLFYEGTIVLMTKCLSEGTSDIGCKIFLKLLAQMYPEMMPLFINKYISLKNSYQNKKTVGLSLIWVYSQVGKYNLTIGLKIWHEVLAPMLESRTYAFHVVKILKEIIAIHADTNSITEEIYMNIVDDFYSGKYNVVSTLSKEVTSCLDTFTSCAMESKKVNVMNIFDAFIDKITPKTDLVYKDKLLKIITSCIIAEPQCLSVWTRIYPKRLYQTELLLNLFNNEWHDFCTKIQVSKFKDTLQVIQTNEVTAKTHREEAILVSCKKISLALTNKMTASKKKARSFSWTKGSIFLLLFIGLIVVLDCKKHGSFEASSTARLLNNSGATTYGQKAWTISEIYLNKGLAYWEKNSPSSYKTAADLGKQYSKLAKDLYLIAFNTASKLYKNLALYVEEKRPLVVASINTYFPGWIESFQSFYEVQLASLKTNSAKLANYAENQSITFIRWIQTSVFVGKMSPESITGYAKQAIDSTQLFANQIYDWAYEKLQKVQKL